MRRCGIFLYRNSVRDRNWIDASKSLGLLSCFLLLFVEVSWTEFFPFHPESCCETCHCGISTVLSSARSRWPVSTAVDNYRPTLTGSLPLDGGSTASLSLTAVDMSTPCYYLRPSLYLWFSFYFILFATTFFGLGVRRSRFRFPMVSLEFFIDIILPAALWHWGRFSL